MADIFQSKYLLEKLSNIIANKLDQSDGQKDKQIEKSIWDSYIGDISVKNYQYGNTINFANAVSHIKTYLSGLATETFNEFCKKFGIDEIDENGNIITSNGIYQEYDNEGNLLTETQKDKNGTTSQITEFDYDEKQKKNY